jgi:hypothetical protein
MKRTFRVAWTMIGARPLVAPNELAVLAPGSRGVGASL